MRRHNPAYKFRKLDAPYYLDAAYEVTVDGVVIGCVHRQKGVRYESGQRLAWTNTLDSGWAPTRAEAAAELLSWFRRDGAA